ncbi:MAG: DMT family transporter [Parachlamydiales bacterium]|jgi:S-adenosylmethionine uptake transporter
MQEFDQNKTRWITQKGYLQGSFWTILCCLTSNLNDILMKSTGYHLPPFQIVFFRSLFGLIFISPLIFSKVSSLKTQNIKIHFNRIILGVTAITLSCYATTLFSLPEVTVLSFSQPLFFLPMAVLLLKEKLTYQRLLTNILGFIGIVIVLNPEKKDFFSFITLVPLASAFLFTYLDIINKKLLILEKPYTLLFYFNLGTTILTGFMSIFTWVTPNFHDLFLLFLLGASATFIQVFSFMSLSATTILSLAPLRYSELIFSCFFSILIFNEHPTSNVLFGSILVIGGVLYATYNEALKKRS